MVGADYALGSLNQQWFDEVNAVAKQHWNAGGLVTLCMCSINNPVTGRENTDRSFRDLTALATAGTPENAKWLAVLDTLAQLRDAGVVVMWRPLHEASAAMADPDVLNCGDLDFSPVDGGTKARRRHEPLSRSSYSPQTKRCARLPT